MGNKPDDWCGVVWCGVLINNLVSPLYTSDQRPHPAPPTTGRALSCKTLKFLLCCTVFLAQNSLRPKIRKVHALLCASALWTGMGICEWGKVEFLPYGLPLLAYASLKGPE